MAKRKRLLAINPIGHRNIEMTNAGSGGLYSKSLLPLPEVIYSKNLMQNLQDLVIHLETEVIDEPRTANSGSDQ